ncbi:hypothetical protein ACQY0O_005519 [Thecaphora frezii]
MKLFSPLLFLVVLFGIFTSSRAGMLDQLWHFSEAEPAYMENNANLPLLQAQDLGSSSTHASHAYDVDVSDPHMQQRAASLKSIQTQHRKAAKQLVSLSSQVYNIETQALKEFEGVKERIANPSVHPFFETIFVSVLHNTLTLLETKYQARSNMLAAGETVLDATERTPPLRKAVKLLQPTAFEKFRNNIMRKGGQHRQPHGVQMILGEVQQHIDSLKELADWIKQGVIDRQAGENEKPVVKVLQSLAEERMEDLEAFGGMARSHPVESNPSLGEQVVDENVGTRQF